MYYFDLTPLKRQEWRHVKYLTNMKSYFFRNILACVIEDRTRTLDRKIEVLASKPTDFLAVTSMNFVFMVIFVVLSLK